MVVGALPQPPYLRFSSPGKGSFITLLGALDFGCPSNNQPRGFTAEPLSSW